jgi:poly(glycerol-phosphate) alpha-glucosyltransferase
MKAAFLMTSVSRRGGGVAEVARQLAWQLQSSPDVEVPVFGLTDDCTTTDMPSWPPLSVKTYKVCGPRGFGYAPGYRGSVREARVDLLHCHGLWMYPSFASLKLAADGLPCLISPHGMLDPWALRNSGWKKRLAGALFEDAHLRRAGCLHALCAAELEAIRSSGFTNPVCVVPNGVELPPRRSDGHADKAALRAKPGQRVLLFLGRVHPKKGLDALIEAWSMVRTRIPGVSDNWLLAIAGWEGQEGYQRELVGKASASGIAEFVAFLGPLYGQDKNAALSAADAFVLPSLSEGMPMAVLEAWAHELPVVMTSHCNLPEGFQAGAALRVESDAASIADGLESLLVMNDSDRHHIGQKGRLLVEQRFTWHKAAADLRSVYLWLSGGGARPDCIDQPLVKAAQHEY